MLPLLLSPSVLSSSPPLYPMSSFRKQYIVPSTYISGFKPIVKLKSPLERETQMIKQILKQGQGVGKSLNTL